MQRIRIKIKSFRLFHLILLFLAFNFFIYGQKVENEKPRLKNFGSSLKKKDKSPKKAQETNHSDDEIIRIESNLVTSEILVLDGKGRSIKGLKMEDFVVKEDETLQKIETFSLGDGASLPRSIVLIIDYSPSLKPYIKTSVEAAKVLVDKLNPKDRMAIVTDDVELLTDFTQDKILLKKKLNSLNDNLFAKKFGLSKQFSALLAVLNKLFTAEDTRPIIIFQTDGDEINSLKGSGFKSSNNIPGFQEKDFSLDDILTAAEKSRASIYTIYPGVRMIGLSESEQLLKARKDWKSRFNNNPFFNTQNPDEIKQMDRIIATAILNRQILLAGIAKFTGGWADFLETPEQASDVYSRIFNGIESRYVIGYYPTNEAKDGKRRKIQIEVRNHPEYVIWGRKTYFAPATEN